MFYVRDRLKHIQPLRMNTQIFYFLSNAIVFLQMHESFLQSCPKEFFRFLCDCIENQLEGNMQSIKKHRFKKFQIEVRLFSLKRTPLKKKEKMANERGLQLKKSIRLPSLTICLYMKQFFLIPASV